MGFKVIIVGGGLSGLGLAHCLDKAGIDYVVLERNEEVCAPGGASMALWPHNARILDQLGLLEGAREIDCNIKYKRNLRSDGSLLQKNNMMESVGIRLGHTWMCFQRPRFLRLLYERLPGREARVLGGKALEAIETTPDGVRVTCQDGSAHEGSVVVGADGANSAVRRHLAAALGGDARLADPFTTSYLGLYGWARWGDEQDAGRGAFAAATIYEVHGDRFTIQVIPGPGVLMFLAYRRLPADARGSVRVSEEEKEAVVREIADVRVAESVRFQELWDAAEWSFCSGLEEGLAERWYGERVVLVGDTVHKMTPNIGLGLNSGWQSAAILTNGLRRLLQKDPAPSAEALSSVFKAYQDVRKKDASDTVGISGLYTRVVAWNNPVWKFADQYVTKHIGGDCKLLDLLMIPMVKKGHTLDFLNEDNFKMGTTPWTHGRTVVAAGTKAADLEPENKTPAAIVADVEVAA